MSSRNEVPIAVVTGDAVVDWNIALPDSSGDAFLRRVKKDSWACWHPGGALMLDALLRAIEREEGSCRVRGMKPLEPEDPGLCRRPPTDSQLFSHSYALYKRYDNGTNDSSDANDNHGIWRIAQFLGFDRARDDFIEDTGRLVVQEDEETQKPHLVVIDDSALVFRFHDELWPQSIRRDNRGAWILVKLAGDIAQDSKAKLMRHLTRYHASRLIVVVSIEYFRGINLRVSRGLSWERTTEDLITEFSLNPDLEILRHCAYVVVSFGPVGALILRPSSSAEGNGSAPNNQDPQGLLVFEPSTQEDTWEREHDGRIVGNVAALTAALARSILKWRCTSEDPGFECLAAGVTGGLAAMDRLYETGFAGPKHDGHIHLGYPTNVVAKAIVKPHRSYGTATTPQRDGKSGLWRIASSVPNFDRLAEDIVRFGFRRTGDVPILKFDKLVTIDREEIEDLTSIRSLMAAYCDNKHQTKPLSLGVFGPPGSGKGFAVKQLAKSLPEGTLKWCDPFNLSQLTSAEQLVDAFHLIRDNALEGSIPLVFWDEFDSKLNGQELGWLRYFLAPMEDGRFQDGQAVHSIGRAIFVFAGGVFERMVDFTRHAAPNRDAKGRDFISRLSGYINIRGVNEDDPPCEDSDAQDGTYRIVRRAIVLRAELENKFGHLLTRRKELRIDAGVMNAFLNTEKYTHGARSIGAIISMSSLANQSFYGRSALPAKAQLDLHVMGSDFLGKVQNGWRVERRVQ